MLATTHLPQDLLPLLDPKDLLPPWHLWALKVLKHLLNPKAQKVQLHQLHPRDHSAQRALFHRLGH